MNEKMEKMLEAAGKKLGMKPEQLKAALEKGSTDEMIAHMNKDDRKKLEALLQNPQMREKIMNSPQAAEIIRMMKEK